MTRDEIYKNNISWPKVLSLVLSLIPLILLILLVVNLVAESLFAIDKLGFGELFSADFSGVYSGGDYEYGLLPAIWGTVLAVVVAMLIAFPVSLAMAVFSSEFQLGYLGKGVRAILGVLSGIPPIVYALMDVVFIDLFIREKFGGMGSGIGAMRIGDLPIEGSTLLGGILLALLIVPFMATFMDDAIRNVPVRLKEASLALGADRWYTLRKVMLPAASAGIISAAALGSLKAIGDVLIAGWAISWESGLPNPLWDILERTATLTSVGAGLLGGAGGGASPVGFNRSVGYFAGLLLLIFAFIILALVSMLQTRLKKRLSV